MLRVLLWAVVSVSVKNGSSTPIRMIKSSSTSPETESKKERSKVISRFPGESVTDTVKKIEEKFKSTSAPDTVMPVAVYSTSYEVPSTSIEMVSA